MRLITHVLFLGLLFLVSPVTAEEDAESNVADRSGLSVDERAEVESSGEKHEFKAEVDRLMDIIINSLYANRDIFLRELISNAADASDKLRFQSLSDSSLLGEGDLADLDIRIQFDKEAKTITLRDKGVGMTKDDLIKNLGTVAKSGTTEFLEAAKNNQNDDLNLIGQFGVGFYSVYLVADKVTVVSKSNNDKQYIWESTANQVFTVAEDPRGDTLGRGTEITLHLKEDAEEFLKEEQLKDIIERYSQFVNVPIFLETSKEVSKEVPIEEEEEEQADEEDAEDAEDGEDLEVEEEEDEEEEEDDTPKTKTVMETVTEWTRINAAKAIWTRDPKEITDEEYESFFGTLTKNKMPEGAMKHIHFSAEGEISFKSLLYIPKKADRSFYSDVFTMKKSGVHLYVRRVLISDEFEDFLPRYINFVKGVVDSEDLPLNVSRETLAQSRVLKVMGKKLVRKILDTLRQMAEAGEAEPEDYEDEDGEELDEEALAAAKEEREKAAQEYDDFWQEFGKSIKFGLLDDRKNQGKLSKLLRFPTSKSDDKQVSLQSYLDRMLPDQKHIYYITGESMDKVKNSPFLEKVLEKGYEVIYMVDALDEYVVGSLTEYEGVELASVTKEGLKLGDEDRKGLKDLKEEYKPLTKWFKEVYGSKVEKVTVSNRLGTSPCVLVTGQYGWSANMQRIMTGSTMQTSNNMNAMFAKKTMEINVLHPIMQALNSKMLDDSGDESLKDLALILLDSAMLQSGFPIEDTKTFNTRMGRVLSAGLGVDPDAKVEEEVEDEPDEDEDEEDEDEDEEVEELEEEEHKHEEL